MTKLFQILDGHLCDTIRRGKTLTEARKYYAPSVEIVEAPDYVFEVWGYDPSKQGDERFTRPVANAGFVYDEETGTFWNPEAQRSLERESKHAETTNDTLQALRKIREGDTTIDWSAWLDQLDAYNVAIERTTEQADYPLKVVYPEYPKKPDH